MISRLPGADRLHPVEVQNALDTMVVLIDTREQDTPAFRRRVSRLPCKWRREMCGFGDYSAACTLPSGAEYSLNGIVAIERKMNLEELSRNYTAARKRFEREFGRMRDAGGKLYLLVENASWERVYGHKYKTRFDPKAYAASLCAWMARYDTPIVFCQPETAPILIYQILYRELKERLTEWDGGAEP